MPRPTINQSLMAVRKADATLDRAKLKLNDALLLTAKETAALERKAANNRKAMAITIGMLGYNHSVDQMIEFSQQKHIHTAVKEYAQEHVSDISPSSYASHRRARTNKERAIATAQLEYYVADGFLTDKGAQVLREMREYVLEAGSFDAELRAYLQSF